MSDKEFYLIATAAEGDKTLPEHVFDNMQGFLDCLENPIEKGRLLALGVWHKGEIKGSSDLKKSYEMGKSVK